MSRVALALFDANEESRLVSRACSVALPGTDALRWSREAASIEPRFEG